jgi:hypothetical protein
VPRSSPGAILRWKSPVAAYAGLASILADCARREGELFRAIDAALGR